MVTRKDSSESDFPLTTVFVSDRIPCTIEGAFHKCHFHVPSGQTKVKFERKLPSLYLRYISYLKDYVFRDEL